MTNNTETQTTTRRVAIGSLNQGDTFILRVGAHEYPATVALTTPDAIMYTSPELTAVVPGFGTTAHPQPSRCRWPRVRVEDRGRG
jgi:hypothetical protein